jgi:prepilin-type N-terminal cleavage/methylation domain-containing protein
MRRSPQRPRRATGLIPAGRRAAFTLIELLVVMGILLILMGIMVGMIFMPERDRATKGADMLQGWLHSAKNRALRDKLPTGLRLTIDPRLSDPSSGLFLCTELAYIQQPDTIGGWETGALAGGGPGPRMVSAVGNSASFQGVDFSGVQPGDYLEIKGGGLVHMIVSVQGNQLVLASSALLPSNGPVLPSTTEFRIIRRPRLLVGESPLRLPEGVVIDLSRSQGGQEICSTNVPVDLDLLFAPSGQLVSRVAMQDQVVLWVRDTAEPDIRDWQGNRSRLIHGQHMLVAIKVRTGSVGVHPVNLTAPDAYQFTKDNRSSGL